MVEKEVALDAVGSKLAVAAGGVAGELDEDVLLDPIHGFSLALFG
jgi:hypothetical protein